MSDEWQEEEAFLAVGIDFGTTFSGVAWALSTRPKDIDIISSWDSDIDHNSDSAKVPTRISYTKTGTVASWGFDHDAEDQELAWFKLLLCEATKDKATAGHSLLDKVQFDIRSMHKDPVDVVADYLTKLWSHASGVLKSRLGEVLYEAIPIKIILTTPAIWDHQAQALTRKAAEMAGMVSRKGIKLETVSEPEAAARYVLNDSLSLQVGDTFVICDAGGGTVDLISYKVEETRPLKLAMCSQATGDLYGAVFLDDAFKREIQSVVGEVAYEDLSERSKKKMMGDWEHGIKRNFKHNERASKDWYIDIPGYQGLPPQYSPNPTSTAALSPEAVATAMRSMSMSSRAGEPGVVKLKTYQLEKIFSSVCPHITELVQVQTDLVKQQTGVYPRAIFLVGGFGANKYLKQELQAVFPKIEIQQPRDAWSAISRGAVLKGINDNLVTNHISRYNYGIRHHTLFIEGVHAVANKHWSDIESEWKAIDQMRWYITKGVDIPKSEPIRHKFYITVTSQSQLLSVPTTIYYSSHLVAPKTCVPSVQKLCTINASFAASVYDDLPVVINGSGVAYRKLFYTIEMKVTSGSLEWSLDYQGMKKGSASIGIEYSPGTGMAED